MLAFLVLVLAGCAPPDPPGPVAPLGADVLAAFDLERMKADIDFLAGDELGGRMPTSPGHAIAADYVEAEMIAAGLEAVSDDGFRHVRQMTLGGGQRWALDQEGVPYRVPNQATGINLLGVHPGTDPLRSDEYVLLVAHYDHLGVTQAGEVFNGAFDDAAGVAALLEIARVFREQDVQLPRSVLFLISDGEEAGLAGMEAWIASPTVALEDVAAMMSVDPLGRGLLTDYWPLAVIGAERSPELRAAWEAIAPFAPAEVVFANRTPLLFFASDQDALWQAPVPVPAAWVASPGMSFYHTTGDDPETIDYRTLRDHVPTIALATAELGRGTTRFEDRGEQPLTHADFEQGLVLLRGVQASAALTDAEQARIQDFIHDFEDVPGDEADAHRSLYAALLFYLIRDLTPAHPGPVPPPWPEP